jgi:hypothetical protein
MGVPKVVPTRALSELGDLAMECDDLLAIPRSSGFAHNLVELTARLALIEATAVNFVACEPRTPFVHSNHPLGSAAREKRCTVGHRSALIRIERTRKNVSASMPRSSHERLLTDGSPGKRCSTFNCSTIVRRIVAFTERAPWLWLRWGDESGRARFNIEFLFT